MPVRARAERRALQELRQVAPSPYSQYPPGRDVGTVATTTAIGTIVGAAVGRVLPAAAYQLHTN